MSMVFVAALLLNSMTGVAQTSDACVSDCDKQAQKCQEDAVALYVTCGQQGGTQEECTKKKNDYLATCGCSKCSAITPDTPRTGLLKTWWCKCGEPLYESSCQTDYSGNCPDCTTDDGLEWQNCSGMESQWQTAPTCDCVDPSPVVIDILGDGLQLTNRANGVPYDLNGDGTKNTIPWLTPDSDDAWLVLDRNGDGLISNGAELFGTYTQQSETDAKKRNGFLALAEFDKPALGGNDDGQIDQRDNVYLKLLLWQDKNHDGVSEASELHSLNSLKVYGIDLKIKDWQKVDIYGNEFRYRVKLISEGNVDNWAYDVFFPAPVK
jgi:hypothetical protein